MPKLTKKKKLLNVVKKVEALINECQKARKDDTEDSPMYALLVSVENRAHKMITAIQPELD